MADYEQVDLFEVAKWNPIMTYSDGPPQSIAGYVITAYLLDKKGGTRLLEVPVTNLEDDSSDGTTGRFQPWVTQAQNAAFRAAQKAGTAELPTWFEMMVSVDGVADPYSWMNIPVLFHIGGE